MPPKKSAASQQSKRIHWVFRCSYEGAPGDDDAITAEGEHLFGQLVNYCDAFAFQLESAPTTGYLHFQGYFALTNKNRYSWIQNHIAHFEYIEKMKTDKPHQAWAYATKQETCVLDATGDFHRWTFGTCPEISQKKDCNKTYREAIMAPTVSAGMEIIKEEKPRDYCLYGSAIKRHLEECHKKKFEKKFTLEDFNREALDLKNKSTVLYGPTNTGKTSFAIAHFQNPLVVSHMDALKKFTSEHDAIIFDDMSFNQRPIEGNIHLVDQDVDRDIHIRYSTALIPANTTKVFTNNSRDIFYTPEADQEKIAAVDRRVQYIHVPAKLFGKRAVPEEYAEFSGNEEEEEDKMIE